jgi:glycosyltransferase involved in cell wall biosynthesis
MRILWSVNLIPADMAQHLHITSEVLGGWVEAMASQLQLNDTIELAIACKCEDTLVFDETVHGIRYFSLNYPKNKKDKSLEDRCKEIITAFAPDVVHIEGTEFLHAKVMIDLCKSMEIPVVVSLQGILNGQYQYQCGQLPIEEMMFSRSLTNIFAAWILHLRKVKWFKPRMKPERELLQKADYILGRTTWDRAHSYAINPNARYFSCNRVLRQPFYETNWHLEKMERHSIYVGNGYYALKGLHYLVCALPLLIREYPDVKVYVAGYEPYSSNDSRSLIKKGYGAFLKKMITDLGVENHIHFTGPMSASQVAEKLSKVNAYVLTSTIENSPNSFGEAMMVGIPCVASYVGGVSDMADDGKEALFYRNDDPQVLAYRIKQIFDDDQLATQLSEKGRARARITHDAKENAEKLLYAYQQILDVK